MEARLTLAAKNLGAKRETLRFLELPAFWKIGKKRYFVRKGTREARRVNFYEGKNIHAPSRARKISSSRD